MTHEISPNGHFLRFPSLQENELLFLLQQRVLPDLQGKFIRILSLALLVNIWLS